MAAPYQTPSSGGCFSKLLFLVLILPLALLGAAIYFIAQPQDLSDIGGYNPPAGTPPARNIKAVLQNAVSRDTPVTLSETEVNQWLAQTLATKQGGELAKNVSLDRVWVRFEDGHAEVVMERRVMGKPFTISMYLQVERVEGPDGASAELQLQGGPYLKDFPMLKRGGRFGKVEVPQGFLLLVIPGFEKLAMAFPEEIEVGFKKIDRSKFEKDRVTFDPREPLGNQGMPKGFEPRSFKK
jgi:hypothetical protein